MPERPAGLGRRAEAPARRVDAGKEAVTDARPRSAGPSSSTTGELRIGVCFGNRYDVLSVLGQGGMGRVYKVRDRELDRLIALKTIRLEMSDGPEALARFKQELLLARRVTHRNVVRIFDFGQSDGIRYLTMEYIEGESLKALVRRRGKLPPAEVHALAVRILSALEEAHAQGIVHRDLKPQNVMVAASDGSAHLMDFGIARATEATGMTATGDIVGTPDYMSPEQVKGEKAGPPSDVFAFGVMLYELLTGELPYQADTPVSKVMMRLSQRPRPVRQLSGATPKYLEAVVRRCLEIDPALRYGRAGEVLADLQREAASGTFTLRVRNSLRRRRRVAIGALVAGLAVVGAAVWTSRRPAPAGAQAAPVPGPVHTLAILPLANATGARELDWMRSGLAEMLVTDLSQSRYVRPIPTDRVYRILREIGAGEQSRFDESALDSISTRAAARTVLYGQFLATGPRVRLDLTLRRADSGVPQPIKVEGNAADLLALVDQISREVKQRLDLPADLVAGDVARPFSEVATGNLAAMKAYQDGQAAWRAGSLQTAVAHLRKGVAADPGFTMAWTRLAEVLWDAGQQREAEAAVERAQELARQTPLPLVQSYQVHAIAASVAGDSAKAANSYGQLVALYPQDPDLQSRLATIYRTSGRTQEAIAAYQRVLQLSPGYGSAEIDLAGVYWQAGRLDEAKRSLQATLAAGRFEGDAEALGTIYSILGNVHRDTGRLEEARKTLTRSLAYRRQAGDRRGQVATLTNLASVESQDGVSAAAVTALKEALEIARSMRDAARESFVLNCMGLTQTEAGRLEEALSLFRSSLQIELERGNPSDIANRLDRIADVYRALSRYDDALVYLEQARAQLAKTESKQEAAINQALSGRVHAELGQYREALASFHAALPTFKLAGQPVGIATVNLGLAAIYERQGRYEDAWSAFEAAVAAYEGLGAKHDAAEARAAQAQLASRVGRRDEAATLLGAASQLAGRTESARLRVENELARAELLRVDGKPDAAARALRQAADRAGAAGHRARQLEARVRLAALQLERGRAAEAAVAAEAVRRAAAPLRLRPIEAESLAVLAEASAASGNAERARDAALDAIALAERYEGRPVLVQARLALARALGALGDGREAADAAARANAEFDWIRRNVAPDHVDAFLSRNRGPVHLAVAQAR